MEIKELGHLVLYVADLERSVHFYRDVLGWQPVGKFGEKAAAFSSGRTHHELLLIEVGPGAAPPIRGGRQLGLYHFGLKIGDTDEELREAVDELEKAGVTVVGSADHHVTHSVYILDPDGNEIELYIDAADWKADPELILEPPKALVI